MSRFIGRQDQVAELQRLLRTSRLLTVTAAGGIGKTRLALEVAGAVLEEYPDGVWLVELGPIDEAYLVPHVVAAVLGVPEEVGRPLVETIERAVADRRQLLLMDNCEHLLDAAASLFNRLLQRSAGLRILATSREPLGIAGETVWRVPSLSLPPGQNLSVDGHADQSEAIRLFLDRARSVQADFVVTPMNATALRKICHRLDGIPLAIELAAACISFLTPEQLVRRLDESAHFMTSVDRNAPPRHQTMAAAIEWSYDLLTEAERRFFARLSVFAGGFDLEAAESVCVGESIGEDDVLDLVRRLVTKSLVVAEPAADGMMRYRLLEPLRDFGSDALRNAKETNAVQRRHATFYADMARLANLVIAERAGGQWFGLLTREHDNLHTAMRWLHNNDDISGALIAGTAVAEVWRLRGHVGEARALLALLMSLPGAAEPAVAQAGVLMLAGQLACFQGDLASARISLGQAVALSRELGLAAGPGGFVRRRQHHGVSRHRRPMGVGGGPGSERGPRRKGRSCRACRATGRSRGRAARKSPDHSVAARKRLAKSAAQSSSSNPWKPAVYGGVRGRSRHAASASI